MEVEVGCRERLRELPGSEVVSGWHDFGLKIEAEIVKGWVRGLTGWQLELRPLDLRPFLLPTTAIHLGIEAAIAQASITYLSLPSIRHHASLFNSQDVPADASHDAASSRKSCPILQVNDSGRGQR